MRGVDHPPGEPFLHAWTEPTDDELARRARSGDTEAFDELYRRYQPRIFRFIVFRVGDRDAAADLCQDTFVAAWRGLRSFEPRRAGSVAAWLFRIARNLVVDRARREGRIVLTEAPPVDRTEFEEATMSRLEVVRLLDLLPAAERDVLALRFIAELSREEVAAVLGRTPDAITQLQYRALERLRRRTVRDEG